MSFEAGAAVAILALVGVLLLQRRRPGMLGTPLAPEAERDLLRIGLRYLLMFAIISGAAVAIIVLTGVNRGAVFVACCGLGIIAGTLTRFDLFWDDPKALWLRGLVGDRWATLLYVSLGLGCLTWAGYHATGLSHGRQECLLLLGQAADSHERITILQNRVRPDLPTCERLVTRH